MVRGAYAQRSVFEVRLDCQRVLDAKTLIRFGRLLGRRTTPSGSMTATAAASGSWVKTRTDRSESSRRRPPRLVPRRRSRRETLPVAPRESGLNRPMRYPACPESTVRDLAEFS